MAWQDISTSVYKHNFNTYADIDAGNGSIYVTLQYSDNPDYLSPTKARIRFKLNSSDGNFWDKIYILVGGSDGILLKIKDEYKTNSWPYYSDGFNIDKKYTESTYAIPAFYIIDNGNNATSINSASDAYWAVTHAGWEGGRSQFSEAVGAKSIAIASSDTVATAGSVGNPRIIDNGNNTFTISGSISNGNNNKLKSAKLYYTTDGSTPNTGDSYKSISSAGSYSFNFNIPSGKSSSTIRTYIIATFECNSDNSNTVIKTVYYYKSGGSPVINTLKDNGDNTFKVSVTLPADAWNNKLTGAALCYTTNGKTPSMLIYNEKVDLLKTTAAGKTYTNDFVIPSGCTRVKVKVICAWEWSGQSGATDASKDATVAYHTSIGTPSIKLVDNYDNTFTISGTDATNGTNNTATTTFKWDYTTAYGNSGAGKKNLTIVTPANATRTVYAQAVAVPSWSNDKNKTATTSLAIKQYVAPSNTGIPVISFTKSRLTIKENWTFTWKPAKAANDSSPVKGYRIVLLKNGTSIPIKDTSGKTISSNPSSADWHTVDSSSTSLVIDPVKSGFLPGDTVSLGVKPYTQNGKDNTGNKVFNADYAYSTTDIVKNAGIVHVKVSGAWKEGQVYVKVNGDWKEAETVNIKTGGAWKESQ